MASLQFLVRCVAFSTLVLVSMGYAASLATDTGYVMQIADADANKSDDARPTTASSPSPSPDAAPVGSSTTDSHTVSGGHFPPQPLHFPPEVNQGLGRPVPEGPYRPLPSRPPESSPQRAPEGDAQH